MNFKEINQRVDKAYNSIQDNISEFKPKVAVILGTGLSNVDTICDNGVEVPYSQIEGFPTSTVEGHKGILKVNKDMALFSGRFHYYEGYHPKEIIMPILLAKKIGIKNLIITNASGGINSQFATTDLILINDHINFMGINPLIGEHDNNLGPRFPELNSIYSNSRLIEFTRNVYKDIFGKQMKEGVYIAVAGPSFESAAEIKFFKTIGADLVGMSTVPEIIMASYLEMDTVAISNVTNMASGIQENSIILEEIQINAEKSSKDLAKLLKGIIDRIELN
ncbi:purine-nucleoside phosphorylase [Candidatus Borreliella tachyglossi]|uniref:purine-nucleoside phosphorylase n=1 Tax=Candidatus Borreliella tachyglossi TaxID=1964448 RepID=UPI0040417145